MGPSITSLSLGTDVLDKEGVSGESTTGETKGGRTRHAILDVAISQFATLGHRGASVPSIAREVGVSPSAVYSYFTTKGELFAEAVDTDVAGLIADALPEVVAGRFDGDFTGVFRRLLSRLGDHPLAKRILEGHEDSGAERLVMLPAEVHLQKGIAMALREGQKSGKVRADLDPDRHAAGLEAVVISLLMTILQTGGRPDPGYASGVISVLEASIRPSP